MLQDIRANSQGTIAKIIIGLIVVSFSIFGIESLLFGGGSSGVAEVNGEEITPYDLQQELSVQQRQLLSLLGEDADPALLDQNQLSQQALEVLIQREIVSQASSELGLTTSEQVLGEIIASMEQFQIEGQFSRDMFQSALATAGFTPALFQERMSEDMRIGQLRAGLAGSDFSTQAELELAAGISYEGRDVRYITLPLVDFIAAADVTPEDIQAYYDANQDRFMSDEELTVEYLQISLDRYREPVAEERVREEFELVRDDYEVTTEARVSHILFEGDSNSREARASEVLRALEAGGEFADLAAENSDDIGSASAGGDLGFTAGDTFPEEMETAIAGLAVGERSGLVETDAGTHILLVTERRDGSSVTFAEVAAELEEQIQVRDASDALLRDVETLRDLAFNAADLRDPAEALELEPITIDGVTRSPGEGVLSYPQVISALFSEDVLESGHNSEVLELGPQLFAVLRVAERRPPAPEPLDIVRVEIESQLRDEAAVAAAREEAQTLLATVESGTSVEDAANEAGFSWQVELGARRDSGRLPGVVRERLFTLQAPSSGEVRRDIVSTDPDATYIIEFTRVTPGSLTAASAQDQLALRNRLAGEAGGVLQQQYERSLRDKAEVVVY